MDEQLLRKRCLYDIELHMFDFYIQLRDKHTIKGYVEQAKSLSRLDCYAIVLQIWCMLNEDELRFINNPQKIIPYSIDHYILKNLRENKRLNDYLKIIGTDHNKKYVFAYYLACATLSWGDEVILENKQGNQLCFLNQQHSYFLLSEAENLEQVENRTFSLFQKKIVSLMATDINMTNQFNEHIRQAVHNTKNYFTEV